MPIYPDERCCRKCGTVGFTPANCLQCLTCVYCKKEGHIVENCAKAAPCSHCNKRGHPSDKCDSIQLPPQHSQSRNPQPRAPQQRGLVSQTLNMSMKKGIRSNKRPGYESHVWRQEVGKFHDKWYEYLVKKPAVGTRRAIYVNYCEISFPPTEDIGNGLIQVQIEIKPPGQRHESCFSTIASDSDPASGLALRLRYTDSEGRQHERFGCAGGKKNLCTANVLVDILVDDKPYEDIAKTPCRYLYFTSESKISAGLKRFIGGAYTDTFLQE